MPFQTYQDFYDGVMSHYQAHDFQGALDLLEEEGKSFPEVDYQTHYLKACMTARIGRPDAAVALIQEAIESGNWYSEDVMRNSPSFAPLQGAPQFERLVEICKGKQEEAQGEASMLTLEPEAGCAQDQGCPLFVSFHGNGENAPLSLNAWRSVVATGRLLVAMQSGQPVTGRQFVWDDVDASLQSVQELYANLVDQYNINSSKTIIGGFSMGGEIALRTALLGTIAAQGFILLAPSMPSIDELESLLAMHEQRGRPRLRGYIMLGGDDLTIPVDDVRAVVERLNSNGIATHLGVLPGVAHRYPSNFNDVIAEGIAFIGQQS